VRIQRETYLSEIDKYREKNLIKVLTGIRRSGKSTLMELYIDRLKSDGVTDDRIQHYNFESPLVERELGTDWNSIFYEIYDKLNPEKMNCIFLDEIQQVPHFERLIDGLYVEKNIDLYLTGSNALLLSGELATLLTGRSIEIHVLPYSFEEYTAAVHDDKSDYERFHLDFMQDSTLPEALTLKEAGRDAVLNYVNSVYQSIIEKDIYPRIRNINRRVFENVFKYVLSNIGSEISPFSISKALNQDGVSLRHETVSDYLQKMCDSYLLYKVSRFDIKGKQQLATLEKYYVPDLAIRYLLVGRRDFSDRGHLLENIVYLELLRRGGQIWVGKNTSSEIDFVVKKNDGTLTYYQVSHSVSDEATFEREIRPLMQTKDAYPKYLIVGELFTGNHEGIHIVNIAEWLGK
jgi:predicted AAA+ superfamily ATPase